MVIVLGAGVSGLAVGMASGAPVFEAATGPGGLCSSYYLRPDGSERLVRPPADGEAYRFELGGGHWIFGGDPEVLARLHALAPSQRYERRAAIDLGGDAPSCRTRSRLISTCSTPTCRGAWPTSSRRGRLPRARAR